ncbi:proline and serine-rich protein 2 [Leptodactylus fuscus]|uniref:proline and serine-rich protein 2 n=1 Tax=Leptodactylus fuscus TaxID=238119 RepID=UPI003F4EE6B5
MPSNLMKLSSSSMESEFHNNSDFERSGSFDSQSSQCSRNRSSDFEDENLKYLTNEEKNALMFFEKTLYAFEDDIEEPPLSANSSLGYYSPRSTEGGHSDTDDIIDLVQTEHRHVGISPEDSGIGLNRTSWNPTQKNSLTSQSTMTASSPVNIPQMDIYNLPPDLPAEHLKLHGAIPTPVIIAQKISEKKSDSGNMSPLSPKEKSPELKKSVGTSPINEGYFIFPGSPNAKASRFPNNIIIKPIGKQYNKTIAKAAVNVQERKAQVLANLHGPGLFADEIDAKNRHEQLGRRTSFRDVTSEQTRYEALTKLGLVKEIPVQAEIPSSNVCTSPVSNGEPPKILPPETSRRNSNEHQSISNILMSEPSAFVPLGKTILIKGEETSLERNKRPSSIQVSDEKKQVNTHQEIKRTYSMPRPTTLWSQGITVQFSGRDSSEASRKDALKRLGLLSGH